MALTTTPTGTKSQPGQVYGKYLQNAVVTLRLAVCQVIGIRRSVHFNLRLLRLSGCNWHKNLPSLPDILSLKSFSRVVWVYPINNYVRLMTLQSFFELTASDEKAISDFGGRARCVNPDAVRVATQSAPLTPRLAK